MAEADSRAKVDSKADSKAASVEVAIIGAGLVGALAAIFMARRGYAVSVYEGRPDWRAAEGRAAGQGRSINLALSLRGLTALAKVGLDGAAIAGGMPMASRMIHHLGRGGATHLESVAYGQAREGEDARHHMLYSVSRNGLNEMLLAAAEAAGVRMHFGARLSTITYLPGEEGGVEVAFEGGAVAHAALLLGCDGVHSVVRGEVLRRRPIDFSQAYSDLLYREFDISAAAAAAADGGRGMAAGHLHTWPRRTHLLIALPNADGSFTATLFYPRALDERLRRGTADPARPPPAKEDGGRAEGLCVVELFRECYPDALETIGAATVLDNFLRRPAGALCTVRLSAYDDGREGGREGGRVVLLGDAAHAMVPFYGQGMNAGFEDVHLLDGLLDGVLAGRAVTGRLLGEALGQYSAVRARDAAAICDLALYNYWEMSEGVTRPSFRLRQAVHRHLARLFALWPLYPMVAFSLTPYAEVVARHARQSRLVDGLLAAGGGAAALAVAGLGALLYRRLLLR